MDARLAGLMRTIDSLGASGPLRLEDDTRLFVYGTGSVGRDVCRVLAQQGVPVAGFMDHRTVAGPLAGTARVYSPEDPAFTPEVKGKIVLVLAVHNREVSGSSLVAKLHALGFPRIITLVELYDSCSKDLGDRYWLTGRQFYRRFTAEIGQTYEFWADETSRRTYVDTLGFRLSGDYRLLPEPDLANQYFPADLPAWREPIRLVDCGAYDGDTIAGFLKAGFSIQALTAFEPDQANFRKLARFVASPEGTVGEAMLWPCGLSSATAQLSFASEQGEASSLSAGGNLTVQCVSLDEALPAFAPTLIKMDIEGAEAEALQGARRIIGEHHPGLAISVYHRPEDLWQIPQLVDQLAKAGGQDHASANASYKYYLRSHAYNCFELVFYAVPV